MTTIRCNKRLVDGTECEGELVFALDPGSPGSYWDPPEPPDADLTEQSCKCKYADEEYEALATRAFEAAEAEPPERDYDEPSDFDLESEGRTVTFEEAHFGPRT